MSGDPIDSSWHGRRKPSLPTGRIPVLPPGVTYLIQALNDDSLGYREIASALEKLPSVAARVLALANSAWSAPPRPILALDEACARLGLRVVRSTSIAIAISQPFNPARCPAFDPRRFWLTSLMNADASAWLAELALAEQPSVARTAGLLSHLGLVWLAECLPSETAAALELSRDAPTGTLDRALAQSCGLGYAQAGGMLAEAWQLPRALRDAIGDHVMPSADREPLVLIVSAATRMVSRIRRAEALPPDDPVLDLLGIETVGAQTLFERITAGQKATADMADAIFPG